MAPIDSPGAAVPNDSKAGDNNDSKAGDNNDHLVQSADPEHPANLIPSLCAKFWTLGWVTGTGGGASIRDDDLVYIAPSGVQKELMKADDIYVLSLAAQAKSLDGRSRVYLRSPPRYKPSQCTPLFLAAFTKRGAGCCIHTHSHWAVLVTLILETHGAPGAGGNGNSREFRINNIEQIKGFGRGFGQAGNLGYHDTLRIPVIENTAHEEDLTEFLEGAMDKYPDTYAVLVRRHGVYVWGETVHKAKTQCESLDYLFQLAVEMKRLDLPWITDIVPVKPTSTR
ncbi:Methylthioribulose-1-phosphate dehydratase [Lasiosphaeria miniovina]|uniref:Methylthioribulose-1-phosphate dehydratase n=1 Tax=Lasiosphaeria miniovina TaxID=1954250 RepID=A0AA40BHE0_9PEZI|nr:Methylthioribulose-1-phosphate dehydratase [Lasiosphaeria miniovina]KAK0734277.1 Methylthioribulose-1-phosphate dehydratase [Lasiosphaeria miniovina]